MGGKYLGNTAIAARADLDALWTQAVSPILNVTAAPFHAAGDGTHDDTAAIQAAINAGAGKTVYLPPGAYLISGTGAQCLLVENGCSLIGDSMNGTVIVVAASVGATTDIIRYHAPVGVNLNGTVQGHFSIIPASGIPGRHAVVVDTTDQGIAYCYYERILTGNFGGKGFVTVNPTLNDGWFINTVRDCRFQNGMLLQRAGDTVNIEHCNMFGDGIGIEASFVGGASGQMLLYNNITSKGPAIRIHTAGTISLIGNQCESIAGGNYPGVPVIDLLGGGPGLELSPTILGNSFNAATVPNTDAIHLDYTTVYGFMAGNVLAIAGAGRAVVPTANTISFPIFHINGLGINEVGIRLGIGQIVGRDGKLGVVASIAPDESSFANLPAAPAVGTIANVNNCNTNVWGAVAAAGGAFHVAVRWNGANWTVVGI